MSRPEELRLARQVVRIFFRLAAPLPHNQVIYAASLSSKVEAGKTLTKIV